MTDRSDAADDLPGRRADEVGVSAAYPCYADAGGYLRGVHPVRTAGQDQQRLPVGVEYQAVRDRPHLAAKLRGRARRGGRWFWQFLDGSGDVLVAEHLGNVFGVGMHGSQGTSRRSRRASLRQTRQMRITIKVRPGSARAGVGGEQDGALVVRVSARPVDGKATEAALAAVADAFGVRRHAVTLVTGASSRTKVIDVVGADPAVLARLLAPQ